MRPRNFGADAKAELADLQRDWLIFQSDFEKAATLRPNEQYLDYRRSDPLGQKTEQSFYQERDNTMATAKARKIALCSQACAIKGRLSKQLGEIATTRADELEAEERKRFDQYKVPYVPSVLITTLRGIAADLGTPKGINTTEHSPTAVMLPILDL